MLVEVCANSLESALAAEQGGADRIELCSELGVGGLTPSYGLLKRVRERISIPVRVLIRPHSGHFTYSSQDFDTILTDIALCADMGFEGVVSGVLHKNFELDVTRTGELVAAAGTLGFTFHRAFDWVRDPLATLGQLSELGVDCILSSGQKNSAGEGFDLLQRLRRERAGSLLMPGAGITASNVLRFKESGFLAVHLSGTQEIPQLPERPKLSMRAQKVLPDGTRLLTNREAVAQLVRLVK